MELQSDRKRIDWILDPAKAEIDGVDLPTKENFFESWKKLTTEHRRIVSAGIKGDTIYDIIEDCPGLTYHKFYKVIDNRKHAMRALIIGRMMNLPSDVARSTYIEVLLKNENSREHHRKDIRKLVTTDREHLQELANKIPTTGDGKRQILKELIAYGMQTKEHTHAIIDPSTGSVVTPAVYTLADPRIALISLQEMNKMDHEYAEVATSTSSIESQAERIKTSAQTRR